MSSIPPFKDMNHELSEYVKDGGKGVLRVTGSGTSRHIEYIPRKLNWFEKVCKFFNFGGYRLQNIADFFDQDVPKILQKASVDTDTASVKKTIEILTGHAQHSRSENKERIISTFHDSFQKIAEVGKANLSGKNHIEKKEEKSPLSRESLLASLPQRIEQERNPLTRTYISSEHIPLSEKDRNTSKILEAAPEGITHFAEGATCYAYGAEGIEDFGWGCAWRAIQTCFSAYGIKHSLEELFHLFGRSDNLKWLYDSQYAKEKKELDCSKTFAPYDLDSGWAEPFIGHMAMLFYNIPSKLEKVNGLPGNCYAPSQVFHNPSLSFQGFKQRLETHFEKDKTPVMIDDGTYTLNIRLLA